MKAVSVRNMRLLEERAIAGGISGFELMARAGRSAAEIVRREALRRNCRSVTVVTGKGNNAGDGFVVAALLAHEFPVTIYAACPVDSLKGDALSHAKLLPEKVTLFEETLPEFTSDTLIVDALLGTGFSGAVREPVAEFIRRINSARRPVVSMDLPSGLNGDTGEAALAVKADDTVTFGLPKCGLFRSRGAELSGVITVGDLGIPRNLIEEIKGEFATVFAGDVASLLKPLAFDDYKNTRGRVLIAGGSADYPGAPLLSALGAMRAGAGFVRLATPALPYTSIPAALVVHKLPAAKGCAGRAAAGKIGELLPLTDAVAAGMGWSNGKDLAAVLKTILNSGVPAVLDADALNLLAKVRSLKITNSNTIITPHMGEAARLFAGRGRSMPGKRIECACTLAREYNAVVILKGPQSVIASPDGNFALNSSGTPALGVCGSGDVLSGVAAAFLAAGHSAFDAACMAAFVHGAAGDTLPSRGLIADELPALIRKVIKDVDCLEFR